MSKRLDALKVLQALDRQILALETDRARRPVRIADREADLEQFRKSLSQQDEELKARKAALHTREQDLKAREEKTAHLNSQLNSCKTNKEYNAFQSEINAQRADCSLLEDEILAAFDQVETGERAVKHLRADVAGREKELDSLRKTIEGEVAEIDGRLSALRAKRAEAAEAVPGEVLKTYARILAAKKDGVALALVVDGNCTACYISLTSQEVNRLMAEKDILCCRSCSRILCL